VAFSTHLGDIVGQVFALFVLTVAAAEAAIGLANIRMTMMFLRLMKMPSTPRVNRIAATVR
jgi:NADH:ubiquinone oxidoreductase subunit K